MKQYWVDALKKFAIGTMLNVVFYGLFGFIWNILMGFMDVWNLIELYRLIVFIFYFCVLNWWIYGTSEKARRYLDTLPRDHKISFKEDYLIFLKQEGLPIIIFYTICLSLQVFVFGFTKGYLQAFFALLAPIGMELHPVANWILSFITFLIGYQAVAVFVRWRIRKENYDFLFAKSQK